MSPTALSLISIVLNVLLGGTVVALLRYKIQARAADRVDFESINAAIQTQRDEAWEHIREQDRRIENLEAEINGLRIARDLDPFPSWVSDLQGTYRFVNREFETYFLEPNKQTYRDAVGKGHTDIFGPDFAQKIQALGEAASKRPDGTARAITALDVPRLGKCQVTVHQFPVRFKGAIVAMAGYITVIEPETERVGL